MARKKTSKPFFLLLLIVVLLLVLTAEPEQRTAIYSPSTTDSLYWVQNGGYSETLDGVYKLNERYVQTLIASSNDIDPRYNLGWYVGPFQEAATSLGTDLKHHFQQSYLSLYKPFDTDKVWVPLYTIASRKSYSYDHDQYHGFDEIWQHSVEAYANSRGDCEDHSMILCDWLNALGYEARVATGSYEGEGHAWVVLYLNDEAFVLEATDKSKLEGSSHYPLASALPQYIPKRMFDHENFYVPAVEGKVSYDRSAWSVSTVLRRNVSL